MTPGGRSAPPAVDLPRGHSHGGSCMGSLGKGFKTLLVLAILGGGGWAAYRYGGPALSKFRMNADVETAAVSFILQVPEKSPNETDLIPGIQGPANDRLKSHLAIKARWFVGYGTTGAELKTVRDDHFTKVERAFVTRIVDELRLKNGPVNSRQETVEFPLGAVVRTIYVDDKPWYVVAAWSE